MHVKIGDKVYDANEVPIMLVLSDVDRQQIAAMPPGEHAFCVYPRDRYSEEEIQLWMQTPSTTS